MIRASQILFWFGLSIAASLALYYTSDRVRELDSQLRAIDAATDNEQQTIHVLKAEWSYLSNPARVEATVHRHLTLLRPTLPRQVISLADLAQALPAHAQAKEKLAANTVPPAPVRTALAVLPRESPAIRKIRLAAADTGHINDRMIMERAAATQTADAAPVDRIGMLLGELGSRR